VPVKNHNMPLLLPVTARDLKLAIKP